MQFQNNIFVFSTTRAIREFINTSLSSNTLLPKTFTLGEFFGIIVYSDAPFATDEIRLYYLKNAIKATQYATLGISNDFNTFLKQSDYLFRFFEELTNEEVKISDLEVADTYAFYEDHLKILNDILSSYKLLLLENGYVDKILLPQKYLLNEQYLNTVSQITINIDGYLTNFEFKILCEIASITRLTINIKSTKYTIKNIEKFAKIGLELEFGNLYSIDLTNKIILSKEEIAKNKPNVSIANFINRSQQINFVNYAISQMLINGILADKIAVVLPDENFADELISLDITNNLNFAMGTSIKHTEFFKKLQALYLSINDDSPKSYERIRFYQIDSSIFDILKQNKLTDLTFAILKTLEEYFLTISNDDEVIQEIKRILHFSNFLIAKNIKFNVMQFLKIFIDKISIVRFDYVGGGEVTVLGILETRGVSFDGVIVLDFNESYLPKMSIKDKYLSTNVKQQANLPTIKDRKNLQKHYYSELFKNSRMTFISYLNNDENSPSPFGYEIFGKKVWESSHTNAIFISDIFKSKKLSLSSYNFEENFDAKAYIWSAYKLKDFIECKRRFYFKNILKLESNNDSFYKASGSDIGLVVHKILEETFNPKNKFNSIETLQKYLKNNIDKAKKENTIMIFELSVWQKKLEQLSLYEWERLKNFEVLYTEKRFELSICDIDFIGVIDRIDVDNFGEYLIIDYKTSSNLKLNDESNFQLCIYYLALKSLNPKVCLYDLNNTKLVFKDNIEDEIAKLYAILRTFENGKLEFCKTENQKNCIYCNYKTICGVE